MIRNVYLLFLIVSLPFCARKPSRQVILEFINNPENKILQSVSVDKTTISVKYLPICLLQSASGSVNEKLDNSFLYFIVRVETPIQTKLSSADKIHVDFNMQDDFLLSSDDNSLSPVICQKMENGMRGEYQYIIAFEQSNPASSMRNFILIYKDQVFNTGEIAFVYDQNYLKRIPAM